MKALGVDLGKARTGLATGNDLGFLASPLRVVQEHNRDRLVQEILQAAEETGADLLVVGLPRNMDGTEGARAQNAREIGQRLEELSGLRVVFWDERGTTVTAHGYLNDTNTRGKKRKAVVDAVAAVVILQSYLDSLRLQRP